MLDRYEVLRALLEGTRHINMVGLPESGYFEDHTRVCESYRDSVLKDFDELSRCGGDILSIVRQREADLATLRASASRSP